MINWILVSCFFFPNRLLKELFILFFFNLKSLKTQYSNSISHLLKRSLKLTLKQIIFLTHALLGLFVCFLGYKKKSFQLF